MSSRRYYSVPRLYKSRYYQGAKYSNETIAFNVGTVTNTVAGTAFPWTEGEPSQCGVTIVPATNVLGNRKVKNFQIKITCTGNDNPIIGCLVYVPEGTNVSKPLVTGMSQSLYEPNQNVISSFVIPAQCERDAQADITDFNSPVVVNVSSRLARNLNTGDQIKLIFAAPNALRASETAPSCISGTVNFAIKY